MKRRYRETCMLGGGRAGAREKQKILKSKNWLRTGFDQCKSPPVSASASTRSSSRPEHDRGKKLSPPTHKSSRIKKGKKRTRSHQTNERRQIRARIEKKTEEKTSSLASRSKWHRHKHKGEAEQSKRRTTTKTPRLRQERGRSWGATGIGNHVRSFRFGSSM
jgi:hypothetical protein